MPEYVIHVTTTGSAGSATGTGTSDELVTGYIEAVLHDFHASAPATTDSTVAEVGGLARTILLGEATFRLGDFVDMPPLASEEEPAKILH